MNNTLKNWFVLLLSIVAALSAAAMRPTEMLAATRGDLQLEEIIPRKFGSWQEIDSSARQIINPQQTELLQKLYSQVLTRTYARADGKLIMLSIAYGNNQSDGLALHYPDVCYPAQGFRVLKNQPANLATSFGDIPVKRLETALGQRKEPLTYWSTIGDHVVRGGAATKLAQLRYGFKGQIPDGLIFRISTITSDTDLAYKLQDEFAQDLLSSIPSTYRQFLSGTPAIKSL